MVAPMSGCAPTPADTAPGVDLAAARRYVLGRQTPQGGYCYYRTPEWGVEEPNAPDTLAALECLRALTTAPPRRESTVRWLRALQSPRGSYATLTIGCAAVHTLELLGARPRLTPDAWVRRVTARLLERAGAREWRTALGDALRVVELHRVCAIELGGDEREALGLLLAAARDRAGVWARPGGDLHTTALAVRAARLGGIAERADGAVADFVARCEDAALGLRLAPDAAATSAGALWGGLELMRTLHMTPTYPAAIAASVALLQRPEGGLAARHRGLATLHDTWLGLRAARLLQLTQEGCA